MSKDKFAKDVYGLEGLFRVDLQDDNKWSVNYILSDDPNLQGSRLVGVYGTRGEALESAKLHADGIHGGDGSLKFADGLGMSIKPDPVPDRRGLVAHTRAMS